MDLTVTQQGMFTATGNAIVLPLRGGVDWMRVYNYTQSNFASGAGGASTGVQYYWQLGMAPGDAFVTLNNAGATATLNSTAAALVVGGFTYLDSSLQIPGPIVAITSGTNATPPVMTVVSTAGLATGNIVRLTSSATASNASGFDYSIEVLSPTTFSLRNMIAPGSVFGASSYRLIAFDPIYYPRNRVVSNITAATQAVISTTVDHGYLVSDIVRLNIPAGYGNYSNLNGLQATVVAVTAAVDGVHPLPGTPATFTVNINTIGFGTFAIPSVANTPYTAAQVEAIGGYTDITVVTTPPYPIINPNSLLDATFNRAFIGMNLAPGITSPGGSVNDVIFWQSGTTFSPNSIAPLTQF